MKPGFKIVLRYQFITLAFFTMNFSNNLSAQKVIVGYYTEYSSWIVPPEEIQYQNLTHIIHCFAWPDTNGNLQMYDGMQNSNLVKLAHQNGVKVLLALGGAGDEPTLGFEKTSANPEKRSNFINNAVQFITSLRYDGIDLDWEFPDNSEEKTNYTLFVKEIREEMDKFNTVLLLSMAASSTDLYGKWVDYENIVDDMDWFNLLAYEYNGSWSAKTGHNAPLYAWQNVRDENADASVNYLNVQRKIPKDKIVLGIPFYGKMYASSGLNQTWDSLTTANPVLGLTYRNILDSLNSSYTYNFDEEAKVPYYISSSENRFITFDDTTSVKIKTGYAINKGLKGVMIWEITQDKLSNNSQPLLEQIGKNINNNPTAIFDKAEVVQNEYILYNNYPNPFNPTTTISFAIPKVVDATRPVGQDFTFPTTLKIYDVLGSEISTLVNEYKAPGIYEVKFNAGNLPSGVYFYTLIAGGYIKTNKMMLLK